MAKNSRVQLWNGEKSPVAQLTEDLKLLQAETMKTTVITEKWAEVLESVQATAKKTTVSGGKGDLDAVKRANEEHAKAVSLFKKEQIARKELEKSAKDLEKMRLEEIRLMKAREKAFDDYEKKAQKEIQQAEKQNSLYAKVDQKLSNMVKSYRDLAIRQNLGLKLTKDEQREMERLSRLITKYDQALKMTDASSGKHQRNVGNYKSAFDGLGFSITQLAREMPAFGNSIQTGFMAISNNLPMFFDEIQKLKQANIELVASGQPAVSVFKRLGQSLFSMQTLLSVGVTLITLYGSKLFEMAGTLFSSNKQIEENAKLRKQMNEHTKEGREFVAKESSEMVGYLMRLSQTNKGSKERSKLITEINSKYGSHLKNLQDEQAFQKQINYELLKYLEYQKQRFMVQTYDKLIQANLQKQLKTRTELARVNKELLSAEKDLNSELGGKAIDTRQAYMGATSQADATVQRLTDQQKLLLNELEQADIRLKSYGYNMQELNVKMEESGYNTDKTTKSIEKHNDKLQEQIDFENELKRVLQEINVFYQNFDLTPMSDAIENEMVKQRDSIRDNVNFQVDELDRLINEETAKRIEYATQRNEFERAMLEKELEDEYQLKLESGEKKADVDVWYSNQKVLLNAKLKKSELELSQEIIDINKEQNDKLSTLNDELNDLMVEKADETNGKLAEARRIGAEKEAKYFKLGLIKMQKTDEEIKQAMLENDIRKLEEEIANRKQYNLETVDLELQLYDLQKQIQDKKLADEKRLQQQLTELRKKSIEQLIQMELDKSKRVEESINKEIDKNKELQNSLKEQANAGVDTAKQSLAQLQEAEIEANKKKQAEQKKQESLEKIKIAYGILEQFIAKGDNVASATAKTNASMSIIEAFLNGFKKYFHGTDDTGNGSHISDQYGKITGLTHENEQVWSYKDRSEVGFISRKEAKKKIIFADAVIANPMLYYSSISDKAVNLTLDTGLNQENKILASKLDRVISVLENQPTQTISEEVIDGIGRAVVATYKKGNDKLTKTYS